MFHSLYKSNANKIIYSILLSLTLALFLTPITSCASHPVISEVEDAAQIAKELYLPEKFEWQKVEEGIYRFDFENKVVPVIYHAAKIDLSTKNLEIERILKKLKKLDDD